MPPASWPDRFFVEFDTAEACPLDFSDDPVIVLFFLSWAYSAEMGGTHELALAANHLKRTLKIDVRPLYKYADRQIDTPQDQQEFDRAWQPAAELAACIRAVADHWEHPDAALAPLIDGYLHLAPRLRELAAMCDWAIETSGPNAKVRLTFNLENTEQHTPRP